MGVLKTDGLGRWGARTELALVAPHDQAGAPVSGDVVPHPLHQDENSIFESDQEHQMDEEPEQPCRVSRNSHTAEVCDGLSPANSRQRALVAVTELPKAPSLKAAFDQLGDVCALLCCNRGQTGERFRRMVDVGRHIADDE